MTMLGLKRGDIPSYLNENGQLHSLNDLELIEVCAVCFTSKHEYERGLNAIDEVRSRNICFSMFYNFLKNDWKSQSLVNLVNNLKTMDDRYSRGCSEFDALVAKKGYANNSAPRQKGRLFFIIYALFYDKYTYADITVEDLDSLKELVTENHYAFCGDKGKSDFKNIRRDLFGILEFLVIGYSLKGVDLDPLIISKIVPSSLHQANGASIAVRMREGVSPTEVEYSFLYNNYKSWLDTLSLKNPKEIHAAYKVLIDYVSNHIHIQSIKNVEEFKELIIADRDKNSRWLKYLEETQKNIKSKALYIRDFIIWLMIEHAIDEDDGLVGYEPLLNNLEWQKVTRMTMRGKASKDETPKAVIPHRVQQLATDILLDDEYGWAKKQAAFYFTNEEGESVFNPTMNNLLATLFILPVRGIQAQNLDSGEGDSYCYNANKLQWEMNTGAHAEYWKTLNVSNPQRGFLHRDHELVVKAKRAANFDNDGYPIVNQAYLYVNTNKTADRSVAFSDHSGYIIPWHHEELLKVVCRQLKFIEKHHPVDAPSSFSTLPDKDIKQILGALPTGQVLRTMPSHFFLFRCNLNPSVEAKNFPPTKRLMVTAWNSLMVEIEKRLQDEGADFNVVSKSKLEKFNNNIGGGNSYISYLTIHCTRVTGITRLEQAGVPINLISKFIAGHANIRTTYRYTKYDKEYMSEKITEAQHSISLAMQMSLTDALKGSSVEDARAKAYVPDIYSTSWDEVKSRAWNSNTLGICPNAGTLCEEGIKDSDFLFNGVGKCLTCKYLISGKPFLITIWSHINSLLYKVKKMNDEYTELQASYKEIIVNRKSEYKAKGKSQVWKEYDQDLKKIENYMESNCDEVNVMLAEIYYGNSLFETVRELTNTEDDFIGGLSFEECTDFEHLNSIVESEAYVPAFYRDENLKFKRDTFVDMALMAIGEQPIFLKALEGKERESAISSIAQAIEHDLKVQEGKYLGAIMQIQNSGGVKCLQN